MATLGATFFDLIDLHKRQDNGQMATIRPSAPVCHQ
jgi:hypothetical protein